MDDIFQQRYLEHQERKTRSLENFIGEEKPKNNDYLLPLISVMQNRRSQRIFNDIPIEYGDLTYIMEVTRLAPSSCNRQAVYLKEANPEYAEQILVGGKRWINKASKVLFLFASKEAYKSVNEKVFMLYLDAGVVMAFISLMCEAKGIGSCIVNPNMKEENKEEFANKYGDDYFCGAIALGNYDKKSPKPPKRTKEEVLK